MQSIEVIAPNFSRRLSGVTSTLERILLVQSRLVNIVSIGSGLDGSVPCIRVRDLLKLRKPPPNAPARVWHARRNLEMLAGLVLRDILRFPLRLVFTSASQRRHTRWTRFLISRMDALIATSAATTSYLLYPSTIIGHGIDSTRFHPTDNSAKVRATLGLPELKLVGCFGRIRPSKGTDVFVDAMLRVLASRPNAGAIVVGRATGKHVAFLNDLTLKISSAGLNNRLLILPEVRTFEIPNWYRALDLFVAPQRWEGFGVTPLEAMASGVPVVATTVGAFSELVTPDTGLLVPPKDVDALASAIAEMLDQPHRRAAMGLAGRERAAKHFSIDTEAEQIIQVYRDVLSASKRSLPLTR